VLRCIKDGGQLLVFAKIRADASGIADGTLRSECSREYSIKWNFADGLKLHSANNVLEIGWADGRYTELMSNSGRMCSPSISALRHRKNEHQSCG
jgi:hypothetical protein